MQIYFESIVIVKSYPAKNGKRVYLTMMDGKDGEYDFQVSTENGVAARFGQLGDFQRIQLTARVNGRIFSNDGRRRQVLEITSIENLQPVETA